jgi:small subunit ribosomal protein S15
MSVTKEKKAELITGFATGKADTGSVDVQTAILTERIKNLTAHLKDNAHDTQAKRGLIAMVSKRRKLLKYVEKNNGQRYRDLVKKLGIRK